MNNGTTLPDFSGNDVKVAVNSIQRTLFVERLHVDIKYPADKIIPYDYDNLYPNKVKSIAQRSGTTSSAIKKLAEFISGEGFPGMETIVNREGQTLWDILRFVADQRATFKGFALHFNFNMLGQIIEINPINFDFVRWSKDLKSFVVCSDWQRRSRRDYEYYQPFWPENVLHEMQECGNISEYKGQLLYCIPNMADYYTTCTWDSVLDDAQFEAEAKLYSLSSIQNDYSLGGFTVLPKGLTSQDQIDEYKKELQKDKGSANAGGTRVFSINPSEQLTNWKFFWPVSRNNIDNLHKNQLETAKFNIYAAFNQPPILSGVATGGMFNQESFADAFHYYNTATETERKETEKELNKILKYSVWSNLGQVQIKEKTFALRATGEAVQAPAAPQAEVNEHIKKLSGREMQGFKRIIRDFNKGETTFDQAAQLLKTGYGLDEEQIKVWLINEEEI